MVLMETVEMGSMGRGEMPELAIRMSMCGMPAFLMASTALRASVGVLLSR